MIRAGTFRFFGGLAMMALSGGYLGFQIFAGQGLHATEDHAEATATCAAADVSAPNGERLVAEVAMSRQEREQGLSGRASMAPGGAMIFVFDPPREVTMWMRDTSFPVDFFFLQDRNIEVSAVSRGAEPFSEVRLSSTGRVAAVLATAAGEWPDVDVGGRLEIACRE